MSDQRRVHSALARVVCVLVVLAGLWILGSHFVPALGLEASDARLAPLTFRSPIGEPELDIRKSIDNEAPEPGDVIEYTLSYSTTNPGSRAYNVRLYDFLPAGLNFISSSPAGLHSNGAVFFTADTVGPETKNVTIRANVLAGYRELRNHALVSADWVGSARDSLVTSVTHPTAQLRLDKEGYSAVLVGDVLVYTVSCANVGERDAYSVTVLDILPAGVELQEASPIPDREMPVLRWTVEELAPGDSFEAVITSTAPSAGVITNTALADALQMVVTQDLLATQVVTEAAILRVRKEGSASIVGLGDELHYVIRYENAGNQSATGVVVTDTLPSGVSLTSAEPDPATSGSGRLTWDIGPLDRDAGGTITVTVEVEEAGPRWLQNAVDITGDPGSLAGHDEERTWVRPVLLFLPVVMRNY